jgi:hypothetical protein
MCSVCLYLTHAFGLRPISLDNLLHILLSLAKLVCRYSLSAYIYYYTELWWSHNEEFMSCSIYTHVHTNSIKLTPWKTNNFFSHSRNSELFMEYKGLLLCSEEPTTGFSILSLIIPIRTSASYFSTVFLVVSCHLHLGLPLDRFCASVLVKYFVRVF